MGDEGRRRRTILRATGAAARPHHDGEEERVERLTLEIDGMSCDHCVRAVTEALRRVNGVRVEHVDIGTATVHYDPAKVSVDQITDAVNDEGYSAARG